MVILAQQEESTDIWPLVSFYSLFSVHGPHLYNSKGCINQSGTISTVKASCNWFPTCFIFFSLIVQSERLLFFLLLMLFSHYFCCLHLAHLPSISSSSVVFTSVVSFKVAKIFHLSNFLFISTAFFSLRAFLGIGKYITSKNSLSKFHQHGTQVQKSGALGYRLNITMQLTYVKLIN